MQTELERPSQFRVLMRIPRLRHHLPDMPAPTEPASAEPADEMPVATLEFKVSEVDREVTDDIAAVQGRRWSRSKVLVSLLVLAVLVVAALRSRDGGSTSTEPNQDIALETPAVTLPSEPSAVAPASLPPPGGTPDEITDAPELALPEASGPAIDPLTVIQRLPPAPPEATPGSFQNASVPGSSPDTQSADGIARLDKGIVTPQPDAQNDSSRPGLY